MVVFATRDEGFGQAAMPPFSLFHLRVPIFVLTLLAWVALAVQIKQTQAEYGNALGALLLAPKDVYYLHTEGELAGAPYFSLAGLAASALAGFYTARVRKLTLTALLPLLTMIVSSLVSMTKSSLLIGSVLFAYCYAFAPGYHGFSKRGLLKLTVAGGFLMAAFMFMSSFRGSYAAFDRQTQVLNEITDYVGGFPTLYFYLSAPPPAFSQYLLHPEIDNYSFFGSNTFAPFFRFLAKLGFRTFVPFYTPYYYTPTDTNQAKYLAYIDADFGPAGVALVPFVLSSVLSLLYVRNSSRFRCWRLMLYAFLLVVMTFSFSGYYITLTYWLVSCVVSSLVGWWIDNATDRQHQLMLPTTV